MVSLIILLLCLKKFFLFLHLSSYVLHKNSQKRDPKYYYYFIKNFFITLLFINYTKYSNMKQHLLNRMNCIVQQWKTMLIERKCRAKQRQYIFRYLLLFHPSDLFLFKTQYRVVSSKQTVKRCDELITFKVWTTFVVTLNLLIRFSMFLSPPLTFTIN